MLLFEFGFNGFNSCNSCIHFFFIFSSNEKTRHKTNDECKE